MLVECIGSKGTDLPRELLELGGHGSADYGTTVGDKYIVYGMSALSTRSVTFCLGLELYDVPAELFKLSDGRLSRYWIYGQDCYEAGGGRMVALFLWGYPEFVNSNDHRLGLAEGQRQAVDIFEKYRLKMELEFASPAITRLAKSAGDGWIMCDECADAWQPLDLLDELVRCPACGTIQRSVDQIVR